MALAVAGGVWRPAPVPHGLSSSPRGPFRVRIAYTSTQVGELRSCGCSKNDLGGLPRRATWLARLRRDGIPLLVLDSGDMLRTAVFETPETAALSDARAGLVHRVHEQLGLDAMALGEIDLAHGLERLEALFRGSTIRPLAANLHRTGTDRPFPGSWLFERGGARVGVIGVLGDWLALPPGRDQGLRLSPAASAIAEEARLLRAKGADLVVLLSHQGLSTDLRHPERLVGVDLVLAGHTRERLSRPMLAGKVPVLSAGTRGKYAGLVDLWIDPAAEPGWIGVPDGAERPTARVRVAYRMRMVDLDSSIPEDPGILAWLDREAPRRTHSERAGHDEGDPDGS